MRFDLGRLATDEVVRVHRQPLWWIDDSNVVPVSQSYRSMRATLMIMRVGDVRVVDERVEWKGS